MSISRQVMRAALGATILITFLMPTYAESPPNEAACLARHGENGQSQTSEVPSLGAQPEYYITIQLVMFRDKLRAVDVMNQALAGASDDSLRELARFVSKLRAPEPVSDAPDPARIQRAECWRGKITASFAIGRIFLAETMFLAWPVSTKIIW